MSLAHEPPGESQSTRRISNATRIAFGVTAGAFFILLLKLFAQSRFPSMKLDDPLSLGLLVVAILPWLSHLLTSAKLPGGWELVFRDIKENQERQNELLIRQQKQIRALMTAVRGIVTAFEHEKLVGLNGDQRFEVMCSDDMFDELKRLRALGLIRHFDGTGLNDMRNSHKDRDHRFNLKDYFYITEDGKNYPAIRMESFE